jgi:hypothetical protein
LKYLFEVMEIILSFNNYASIYISIF